MKFNNILFPIDFSDHSYAMNPDVEWLAQHFNSSVTLLHVFEVPTSWYGGGEAPLMNSDGYTTYAESEKQRLKDYSIQVPESRVTRISAEGSAAWHIKDWVEEHKVDLIVMGTHGYGPLRRLLLGSVTMKVLHDVKCPVWTHPAEKGSGPGPRSGISRILCSIGPFEEAIPLLHFSRDLAAELGAEVQLVHCVPETESRPSKYFDCDLHRSLKSWAQEEISSLQEEAGTCFPLEITENLISHDIAESASKYRADLVVIGRGRVQDTLGTLRTHAYEIIREAPCPVLSFCMAQKDAEIPNCNTRESEVQSVG